MLTRRTKLWGVTFFLLLAATWMRAHHEISVCNAFYKHLEKTSAHLPPDSNAVGFIIPCQPGELEPWWMKLFILGLLVSVTGAARSIFINLWQTAVTRRIAHRLGRQVRKFMGR